MATSKSVIADPIAASKLTIVDFGAGMAAALVAKQFAELGATVYRVSRDGGDPFDRLYPAHRFWRRGAIPVSAAEAERRLAQADVCILGGEDHPDIAHRDDDAALTVRHPALVIVRITGYPTGEPAPGPAIDLLVQARTGVVHEQFSDRPIAVAFPQPGYGAALQALLGAWVALIDRERSGRGQIVRASMAGGAAMFWGPFWMKAEHADAGFTGITPRDVRHLILRCAEGEYLQLTMGVPGAVAKVHRVMGITAPVDPADRGMPDHRRGPALFYGDVDLLESHSEAWPRDALVAALREAGVPAEAVLRPGESWADEQTRTNEIIVTDDDGSSGVGSPIRITPLPGTGDCGQAAPLPPRLTAYADSQPPLAGLRIIDFGIFVAGPYAAKLLADYGATVIRVEPPSGRSTLSGERTIIAANHGKLAMCVDMKTDAGRAIAMRMCAEADIVMHNFRPGVADRLGFGRSTLQAINPGLIMLETSAYGATGPKSLAPGFDMVMQAHCGLSHRAGGTGNAPLCSRSPMVDFASGAVGAIGLLVALFERLRTGRAMAVETNLLNVGTHMMSELVRLPDGRFRGAPAVDATQTGTCPANSLYRTADDWIAIAIRGDAMAAAFARTLDIALPARPADWGTDDHQRIAAAVAREGSGSLLQRLEQAGVWAGLCVRDAWDRRPPDGTIVRTMNDGLYGHVVHCIGPLVEFSRSATAPAGRLATPEGADTALVLDRLAVPESEAKSLFKAGIVR